MVGDNLDPSSIWNIAHLYQIIVHFYGGCRAVCWVPYIPIPCILLVRISSVDIQLPSKCWQILANT